MRIDVQYFAVLRDRRGLSRESVETDARTASDLYLVLADAHGLRLPLESVRAAVEDEFVPMGYELKEGDSVTFIPPVAGG
jgi:molybdopterin converting factor small subunit